MAYDPYDRGDNPWRSDFGVPRIDMPRSRPSAKPGAGRASSAAPPAKKKKPAETYTSTKPQRPAGGMGNYPVQPIDPGLPAEAPLPPTRPFELTPGAEPMEQAPAIPGGILGGPPPVMPAKSPAEQLQPLNPGAPPAPMPVMNSTANDPAVLRPTQSTGLDDWLKRMLSQASTNWNSPKPTNPMFDPNRPSGSVY